MKLSIIIVNYKTYELTKQTIESVLNTVQGISYEILVVDNYSCDGSIEKLENDFKDSSNLIFICNDSNDGFAVANNLAYKKSSGEYILLLNSDVIVHEDSITKSLDFMINDESIGILGCKVVLPNGQLDKACRRSFPTFSVSFYRFTGLSKIFSNSPRFNKYNLSYLDDNGIYPVDCVVGAFMLIKSSVYKECGGLDESYFMYGEDIDICYKVKQMGYQVYYYGEVEVTHYKGASGKNNKLLYEFHKSMDIFYKKHYLKEDNFIINFLSRFGIWGVYYIKLLFLKDK